MSYNRLAGETSPYLLQHKDNPVHWWPWGPEAMAEAERANKPILLSVGYAACHWCHVMAHESFEDPSIAALMNELFVNIKVDREERPDVDALYMAALHHLGEQGGWPLTMFLTPKGEPFWGGTYFPPTQRYGRPGFPDVLRGVARAYSDEPEKVLHNASRLIEVLGEPAAAKGGEISEAFIADITVRVARAFDPVHGGLQGAPKFPNCSILGLLWKAGLRYQLPDPVRAVETTLTNICQGGIYDHVGGGFARYAVDAQWLVPHFEKMLYDNAQLVSALTEVWKERRDPLYRQRVYETIEWLRREMIAPDGGFASALDADSEGVEGKFYVWSLAEIESVLGAADAELFARVYDISAQGNWEHANIPNRLATATLLDDETEHRLSVMRGKLLEARAQRIRPSWDDKVLADWNGLMITALVQAASAFGEPLWMHLAREAYRFVTERMTRDGRLMHSYRAGQAKTPAVATDYADMIQAALSLYQAENSASYLADAEHWSDVMDTRYISPAGGYDLSADDTRDVMIRTLAAHDDATPSANAVMLGNLSALYLLTGKEFYARRAERLVAAFAGAATERAAGHCGFLSGALDVMSPVQVVIVGDSAAESAVTLRETLQTMSLPGAVVQTVADAALIPAGHPASGKTAVRGQTTVYVCVGQTCSLPVTTAEDLRVALAATRRSVA